jgi:hypothetical protein
MSLTFSGRRLLPDNKSEDLPTKHVAYRSQGLDGGDTEIMMKMRELTLALACLKALTATAQSKLDSVQHVREIIVVSKPAMREVVPSQKLKGELQEQLNTHSVAPYAISQVSS